MKCPVLCISIALAVMASCSPKYSKPTDAPQTDFSVSFFTHAAAAADKDANVIVSPYSAAIALSMLEEGAAGQTKVEIDNVLGGGLFKAKNFSADEQVVIRSANSVWVDDDFSIRNRYVSLLEKDFDAFITTADFSDPATLKYINNWCSENTEGKITEVLSRLNPDDVLLLINALYFNGSWETPFAPHRTRKQVFHGVSGDTQVDMMTRKAYYGYAEYHGAQMLRLPYKGGEYCMYVVLPPAGFNYDAALGKLDSALLTDALNSLEVKEVQLSFPKFKLEISTSLNGILKKMGMQTAFTSAADLSAIAEMGPLKVNSISQKCYMDVTESGTEAAAVTNVAIGLTSVRPSSAVRMTVDRPFFFFISDSQAEDVLFAGRIVNL